MKTNRHVTLDHLCRCYLHLAAFVTAIATFSFAPPSFADQAGALDPTFGDGGMAQIDFGGGKSDYGRNLALQADGRIVVVGFSGVYPASNSALARLNSDGTADSTFGIGGKVITAFRSSDNLTAVAIQPDGKIVAVGAAAATSGNNGTQVLVARYNSNGTLDNSFGAAGATITDLRPNNIPAFWYFSASAQDIAILDNGQILVAAQTTTVAFGRMALLRYNSDGTLDATFGRRGVATITFQVGNPNGGASAYALAIQPDGKIILGGSVVDNSFSAFALARVNSDGTLDATFGHRGEVTTSLGLGDAGINDLVIQSDGKIVAAGSFEAGHDNHDFALVRYGANGKVDRSFGTNGLAINDLFGGSDDVITSIIIDSHNRIVAAGETGHYPTFDFGLARYTSAGQLDPAFGNGGKVDTDFSPGSFDVPYGAALAFDGKIVVAGETNAGSIQDFDFAVVRYLNP